jgi:hypothetical protein
MDQLRSTGPRPHDAGGDAAETLLPGRPARRIVQGASSTSRPAAYMNEASNSHGTSVLGGDGIDRWAWPVPVDPFGTC